MTGNLSHCEKLVEINGAEMREQIARGDRFVIGYDQRDTGRSTSYPPGRPGYAYTDLVGDALGILDSLNVERAHIVSHAVVDFVVASAKAGSGGSPSFDEAATRALVERDVARTRDYAATLVNHYAMSFDGSSRDLAAIKAPTLVVHGDHDPVCPLPHGYAVRDAIPGSTLLILEGAGHDLPKPLWDVFVPALLQHTRKG